MDPRKKERAADVAKGALAGAIGGAAGAWVMEKMMGAMQDGQEERQPDEPQEAQSQGSDPKVELANRVMARTAGRGLAPRQEPVAARSIHYGMGTVSGAIYGATAEFDERATIGWGTAFGAAVWAAAPTTALPLLGLAPPPTQQPLKDQAVMLGMHALYGAVTETVRRPVRAML